MACKVIFRTTQKSASRQICRGCGKIIDKKEECTISIYSNDKETYRVKECNDCLDYVFSKCFRCAYINECIGGDYKQNIIKECKKYKCYANKIKKKNGV